MQVGHQTVSHESREAERGIPGGIKQDIYVKGKREREKEKNPGRKRESERKRERTSEMLWGPVSSRLPP
jgi:hypothetical protein